MCQALPILQRKLPLIARKLAGLATGLGAPRMGHTNRKVIQVSAR